MHVRNVVVILVVVVGAGCKKQPDVLVGPGTFAITEAHLGLRLPAATSAEWLVVPGPEGKPATGTVTVHLASGYAAYLMDPAPRSGAVAEARASFTKTSDYDKAHAMQDGTTGKVLLDEPDAFICERKFSDAPAVWCEVTACKTVGARVVCASTGPAEQDVTTVDAKTRAVKTARVRITEADCRALADIVRSLTPVP